MTFEYKEYGTYSKLVSIELTDEKCKEIGNIVEPWAHNEEIKEKLKDPIFIKEVLKSQDYLYADEKYGCVDLKDVIIDALYDLASKEDGVIDADSFDSDYEISD